MIRTDKIAILMATYNGELYVAEQIDSLLSQSYDGWELFIHDDGSTDATCEIIEEYVSHYPDKIHFIQGPSTGGAKNNFLFLLNSVDAPYVMLSDQDDVWLPDKIKASLKKMKSSEAKYGKDKALLVFTDVSVVDKELNVIANTMSEYQKLDPYKTKLNNIIIQNVIAGCTMMINSVVLKYVRKTRETDSIIMHDWWLAMIAANYGAISYVGKPMMLYRQHGNNSVGTQRFLSKQYIRNKITKLKNIKRDLEIIEKQTGSFVRTFDLKENKMLCSFASLYQKPKIKRMIFHFRYHVWKNGFVRNVSLLINT